MPKLFRRADALLKRRLDRLMAQFKESNPGFYNEYQTSRSIFDKHGYRVTKSEEAAKQAA